MVSLLAFKLGDRENCEFKSAAGRKLYIEMPVQSPKVIINLCRPLRNVFKASYLAAYQIVWLLIRAASGARNK